MNRRIKQVLDGIESEHSSSAAAFVDHLRTVASNGPEYATPEAMRTEAEAIKEWAERFLKQTEPNHRVRVSLQTPGDYDIAITPEFRVAGIRRVR